MSKNIHRTVEDGRKIVAALKRSGLSQERSAEKLGVSGSVVGYWVRRLRDLQRKSSKQKVKFVEVVTPPASLFKGVEIELPGGINLKTTQMPEPSYLAELSLAYRETF